MWTVQLVDSSTKVKHYYRHAFMSTLEAKQFVNDYLELDGVEWLSAGTFRQVAKHPRLSGKYYEVTGYLPYEPMKRKEN
jgi:hypothetical protein